MKKNSELEQAYEDLEDAVRRIVTLEGVTGLVTDWVCLSAVQEYDADGNDISMVARILPVRGARTPMHRVLGMLEQAKTELGAEINAAYQQKDR